MHFELRIMLIKKNFEKIAEDWRHYSEYTNSQGVQGQQETESQDIIF